MICVSKLISVLEDGKVPVQICVDNKLGRKIDKLSSDEVLRRWFTMNMNMNAWHDALINILGYDTVKLVLLQPIFERE